MKRTVRWIAIIGCMIGYGELRAISVTVGAIGIAVMTCALIYAVNELPPARPKRKRERNNDDE